MYEYRHDFRLFQEINQRAAIGDIPQFDVNIWALCPQFSGIEGSSIRPARASGVGRIAVVPATATDAVD